MQTPSITHTTRRSFWAMLIATTGLISGCGDLPGCTTSINPSLKINVVDQAGAHIDDVEISIQENNKPALSGFKCSADYGSSYCSIYGPLGPQVITASKAGYASASESVTVIRTSGNCGNTNTESFTLVLKSNS